jgi:peptide/nickel transport system substrate-binding protein
MLLVLAACQPSGNQPSGSTGGNASQGTGSAGGTIFILNQGAQWDQTDPQRVYTGEDLAFFGATMFRGLVSFKYSPDTEEATTLVPDLATDTGTPNADATDWKFTLRDGATFEDGSPVTCEDVKYGVSRTFATDVINQGPTYQIAYLDIPVEDNPDSDFPSKYHGPYSGEGQELFDKAVVCDGNTITFHLNKSVPDFNFATTLGFFPVPKDKDTGENYGKHPISSGPYKLDSYTTGNGGKMILVRNDAWDPANDPIRKAFPDKWEIDFGIDAKVMDQRLIASAGNDATAIQYGNVQPENLPTVFADKSTPNPRFEGRASSEYDAYVIYTWINVDKVPNEKIRQAMAVALDRQALLVNAGGAFAGDLADGVIKPNIGQVYAPTGWAQDMFGQAVPPTGNVDLAKRLITESGVSAPTLQYDYAQSAVNDQAAAIVKASLEKAGFTVKPNPIDPGVYYSVIFDPKKAGEFGAGGWGPDWPNASTVIPPLFTQKGGWDISQVDDPELNQMIEDAQTTLDRAEQAKKWQDLNKLAMQRAYVIPTRFNLTQIIGGTRVQPTYQWAPFSSWPYAEMYVTQ